MTTNSLGNVAGHNIANIKKFASKWRFRQGAYKVQQKSASCHTTSALWIMLPADQSQVTIHHSVTSTLTLKK